MRQTTLFAILSLALLWMTAPSCNKALKDPMEYYPQVKTTSVTVQTDGTVLVQGDVISEGEGEIGYVGFCCGTMSVPEMLSRQLISSNFDGTHFTAVYSGFSVDSTYYFRSWATNGYGYSYGDVLSLDSIVAMPVTPPCTITMNTVNIGGSTPTESYDYVTQPAMSLGNWEFDAVANATTAEFTFGSALNTGIYTTTTSTDPGNGQVYVQFTNGSIGGVLSSGTSVYVNMISTGVFEVTICSAPWVYSSSTLTFKTRFTVPS